jgi:dTDP-4-amino-4,6-dideoxygalactose transaminase
MFLKNNGFGVQVNYFPSHCHPVFARMGYKPEDFPNALRFYEEEISLPIYVGLEMAKVDEVCEQIVTFMKARS